MSICVLVADGSRSRIFLAEDGGAELTEHRDLVHPEGRLREQDLVSDGPGSGRDSGGQGMHSMGHETSAQLRQSEEFAREICTEIDRLRNTDKLRRIYLIAPPKFLGKLRATMSKPSAALVSGEIDKNLVTHDIAAIRAHLPRRL